MNALEALGYTSFDFQAASGRGQTLHHLVYSAGQGPVLLLLQEMPGIGPEMIRLAERFRKEGFQVYIPHLFGPIGEVDRVLNGIRILCMRKEFALFSSGETSPITAWLRALIGTISTRSPFSKMGVIGMCLTGNFALSLMTEGPVHAAVASQPSLPVHRHDVVHMSDADIHALRNAIDQKGDVHAYRFANDPMCTSIRFNALDQALNETGNQRIGLHTLPGVGHAVLTLDLVDREGHPTQEALENVVGYFKGRLQSA